MSAGIFGCIPLLRRRRSRGARQQLQIRVTMLAAWYGRPLRRVRDSEVRYAVLLSRGTPLSLNAAASLVAEHGRLARAVAFGRMLRGEA